MADPDGNGVAAMKFSLVGPDNTENAEQWLTATPLRRQHGRRFGEGGIPGRPKPTPWSTISSIPRRKKTSIPRAADDSLSRPRDPRAREQEPRQEGPAAGRRRFRRDRPLSAQRQLQADGRFVNVGQQAPQSGAGTAGLSARRQRAASARLPRPRSPTRAACTSTSAR